MDRSNLIRGPESSISFWRSRLGRRSRSYVL